MGKVEMLLVVCFSLVSSASIGQKLGNFVDDVGKGAEKLANDVADSVDRFVMDNDDLDVRRQAENQQAIDSYRRGEINESQLRTAMWINQYEYQQAVDDRIRSRYNSGGPYYNGGNYGSPGYPGYNGYPNNNGYNANAAMRDPTGYSPNGFNVNGNYGTTTYYNPNNIPQKI